jgi:predicted transcriptional regulator
MQHAKNIDNQILAYLTQVSEKKKRAVLTVVKTLAEDIPSLWDVMPNEVKDGVERGIAQSKKGEGRPHAEVMKKYAKWQKK